MSTRVRALAWYLRPHLNAREHSHVAKRISYIGNDLKKLATATPR